MNQRLIEWDGHKGTIINAIVRNVGKPLREEVFILIHGEDGQIHQVPIESFRED